MTKAKTAATVHKGAPRRYFCPTNLDQGKVINQQCLSGMAYDGMTIPTCVEHNLLMVKPRNKRVEDRTADAMSKAKLAIGTSLVWSDTSHRKAICRLCYGTIEPGERRLVMDAPPRGGRAAAAMGGGVIARVRYHHHASCFIDMVFGGEAGEGCPGCTAKILHDEFQDVKRLLQKEYGA